MCAKDFVMAPEPKNSKSGRKRTVKKKNSAESDTSSVENTSEVSDVAETEKPKRTRKAAAPMPVFQEIGRAHV